MVLKIYGALVNWPCARLSVACLRLYNVCIHIDKPIFLSLQPDVPIPVVVYPTPDKKFTYVGWSGRGRRRYQPGSRLYQHVNCDKLKLNPTPSFPIPGDQDPADVLLYQKGGRCGLWEQAAWARGGGPDLAQACAGDCAGQAKRSAADPAQVHLQVGHRHGQGHGHCCRRTARGRVMLGPPRLFRI